MRLVGILCGEWAGTGLFFIETSISLSFQIQLSLVP